MSPLRRTFSPPGRQRGAIAALAALTLGIALLLCVTLLDSLRLYLEMRALQRIADIAAQEAASRQGRCGSTASAARYATQSATRNGFIPDTDERRLETRCGTLVVNPDDGSSTFVVNAASTEAIQVVASHTVPRSIASGIASLFDSSSQPTTVQLRATGVAVVPVPAARLNRPSTINALEGVERSGS